MFQFDNTEDQTELFLELARIVEVLLSAPSQSFKRFEEVDAKLEPVYLNQVKDNGLDPAIEAVQQGTLQFVHDRIKDDPLGQYIPDQALVKHVFLSFITAPKKYEAQIIGDFPYESKMLQDEEKKFLSVNHSLLNLLKNPRKALDEFNYSNWRAGYFQCLDSKWIKVFYMFTSRHFYQETALYSLVKKIKNKVLR